MNRVLSAAVLALSAAPAAAADFSILGGPPASGGGLGTCTSYSKSGSGPLIGSGACTGDGLGNSSGGSRADFGGVGARATASQFVPSFTVPSIWQSRASFTDSVIFTGAPGAEFADVRVNLQLDGEITGDGALDMVGRFGLSSSAFEFR